MKKSYNTPELEIVTLALKDVILSSPTEETIPEVIGGGGEDETSISVGGFG